MPASALVIRFPDRDFEYDLTRRAVPTIGETMRRKGVLWSVTRIMGENPTTVYVERVQAAESTWRTD